MNKERFITKMRKGLGQEDLLHKAFASTVKMYEGAGKLDCAFYSYDASGEYRQLKTGQLLKAKGLRPGQSDYFFKKKKRNLAFYVYIEFKTEKGKQSESQKAFEETCRSVNESYYIARSVKEGIEILIKEGIIIE
jgi:hypothetical protein